MGMRFQVESTEKTIPTSFKVTQPVSAARIGFENVQLVTDLRSSVLYVPQELTNEQKDQARRNIGALSADAVLKEDFVAIYNETTFDEIMAAHNAGRRCLVKVDAYNALIPFVIFRNDYLETASYWIVPNKAYYFKIDSDSKWFTYATQTFESELNKTQTISSSPSSVKYPSEKAVYEALPKKLSELVDDVGYAKLGDFATEAFVQEYAQPKGEYALISDIPEEDFVAVYDETTFAEIVAAREAGRKCWIRYDAQKLIIPIQVFSAADVGTQFIKNWNEVYWIRCNYNNTWNYTSLGLQLSNLTNSISNAPSNTKYPSEKAVYDALPKKLSDLTDDSTHRLVTDTEKSAWNSKANGIHVHTADDIRSLGYLNTHPESGNTIIPFINNDIAFLLKRGGTCKVYETTDTDFTKPKLTEIEYDCSNMENMFDAAPTYTGFLNVGSKNIVIDLKLPINFMYSTKFYIDFGSTAWSFKNISVYKAPYSFDTYTLAASTSSNSNLSYYAEIGDSIGIHHLRIVLKDKFNTYHKDARIAQIGLLSFGSKGASETLISRGGCSGIYGDLIPNKDSDISLGTNEKRWKAIYADKVIGAMPEVTANDAGKFLRVSTDGAWIAESIPRAEEVTF